ncbi:MAG: sortase [Bacilli bacterium]|nr:sortase [Bacilli bacterium]
MNKFSKYLIILGILCILLSITLYIKNKYQELDTGKKSKEILDIIETKINVSDKEEIKSNTEDLVLNISGYDYIGVISIPSLNIKLPIMRETDYDRLAISPCKYYGNINTNDLVLCAHDYVNQFGKISNLKEDDIVIITDVLGNNYVYKVVLTEELNPTDITNMIDSPFDLTLYTCSYGALKRITVRCNRIYDYV